MKRFLKFIGGAILLAGLLWCYVHRDAATANFSAFRSAEVTRIDKSKYAIRYREAGDAPEKDQAALRWKIRWDLWCIAMSATIRGPRERDGMLFYRVDATDRTDTERIYVFAADGTLLEIAWVPLA
jgi:hypothetical protein